MIVKGYINIYSNGKGTWTGSDIHKTAESAKAVSLSLTRIGGKLTKCIGTFYLEFDSDNPPELNPLPLTEEIKIEDTTDTGRPRRGRPRSTEIRRIGKSDK